MLRQIAWNTFKNTGNINTMMELIEVDKAMKNGIQNDMQKLNSNGKNTSNNELTIN